LELKGVDEQVWLRVAPCLTVNGSGGINLNAASREVLMCLFLAASGGQQTDRTVQALVDRLLEVRADGRLLEGRSVAGWLSVLKEYGTLPPEVGTLLNRAAKWSDVRSTMFEGTAEGGVAGGASNTSKVDFVVDGKTGTVVQWREW
jgi:type II secretory pathway component PulK